MIYYIFVLCYTLVLIAANESQNTRYIQALTKYQEFFGNPHSPYKIPKGSKRLPAVASACSIKTDLIVLANECLQEDRVENVLVAVEIMYLVGLIEFALHEDDESVGFKVSPRVQEAWIAIREKIDQTPNQEGDEYEQACVLCESFFGKDDFFSFNPCLVQEVTRVVDNKKTRLLALAESARSKNNEDQAKKILRLIGAMDCSIAAHATEQKYPSPRVVEAWKKLICGKDGH